MTTDLFVRAFMQGDIVTVTPDTPIRRAVALLVERELPAAPVLSDDSALIGILTQKDCFRPALHASYYQEWKGTVADHMTRGAVTVEAGDDLMRAAEMFLEHPHRVLPVVEDDTLVGLLDRARVLSLLVRRG
ncbi:CBS domain-containing protein [Roseivivax sediminis]|uniref:CBS domain-containing protein n=1 Tax=Roseivivax sediminis TaxID=936889 RepID=A0A1I1VPV9_9RHOB|nr:CBS domain-containing protein [Roseivivax sediminis]SFD84859.1 CBS domain-containing protein [Roseivivax sediminis]